MNRLLIGTAISLAMAAGASAADLPIYKGPAPIPIGGWAGFYAGGHAGEAWEKETVDPFEFFTFDGIHPAYDLPTCAIVSCPSLTGAAGRGSIYGGQFGHNWQPYARWVTGIEADISAVAIDGSSSLSFNGFTNILESKVRDIASVRGKVGFLAWDNILIYGTGGLAFGQVTNTLTSTLVFTGLTPAFFSYSNTSTQLGWSAGGGADWKINDTLILGILYLHYDLGLVPQTLAAMGGTPTSGPPDNDPRFTILPNAHVTVDAVTARASWLFR